MSTFLDDGQGPPQFPLHNPNLPPGALSPYLSIDPKVFRSSEPQYILPEGAAPRRGRFELAFSQIGAGVLAGGGFGSTIGLYKGITDSNMKFLTPAVYRTQMLNYIVKHASAGARPCGVIMLCFAGIGVAVSKLRGGVDDEFNTIISGATTGLLYRSVRGLRTAVLGAGIGATAGLAWVLLDSDSRNNLRKITDTLSGN
jgi:hypothetical protein